jgi:arylsulfatase A-like enzyme
MRTNYRARLESLLAVDDLIGRVVESLVRNGKWNDTVLMVTSDNGFLLGEHRMSSKVLAYEPSIRVPLFIRIPGAAAGRTAALVVNNDLAATVVDLAGAQPDIALDGRSLLPLYTDPQPAGWRKRVLVEYLDFVGRPDSSILQQFFALRTAPTDPYAPNALAVFWNNGSQELYALDQDPAQLTNLASDPQAQQTLAYLKDWVDRLRYCAGLTCQSLENGNAGVSALFRSATNTN